MTSREIFNRNSSLQVSAGAVSFICSTALVYMIKSKKDGLQTPYRRLIFSISASDILQSLSVFLGPFLNVSDAVPWAYWAVGNKHSCRFVGFLFGTGGSAAPMYSCCLSIYYYCKLYKKMSNGAFAHKIEQWLHIVIISFSLIVNMYALSSNALNSSVNGSFCTFAVLPTGCRQRPDIFGECNASPDPDTVVILSLLNSMIIPAASLIIAVLILSILLWRIVAKERIFSAKTQQDGHDYDIDDQEAIADEEEHPKKEQEESLDKQELAQTTKVPKSGAVAASTSLRRKNSDEITSNMAVAYRQEMMAQLLLYSFSLFLVHLIFISAVAIVLDGKNPHHVHYGFSQFLFPLQGLFNILIYLRPAARITRIRRPGSSWIKAYYLVIKNGGEAVKEQMQITKMIKMKYPTSVKFGVENPEDNPELCDASNECMYIDSSKMLSRDDAAFNSCQDWHHVIGSEGASAQEPQDDVISFGRIQHSDLDMVVEESNIDSHLSVSLDSSKLSPRDDAAFNSSQDWHHFMGSEGASAQEPLDDDLDMMVDESNVDSQLLVSSETTPRD